MDPDKATDDVLSNITADPLVLREWLQNVSDTVLSGPSNTRFGSISESTFQYNEEVVQQRVAESAYAEPWTGLNTQSFDFSSASSLSLASLANVSGPAGVHVDEATDSGYMSYISKPLVCAVCSKTFKNKAEEKYETPTLMSVQRG